MRRIYLRADANHQIGWGHVSRMVALGEILSNDFDVQLVSQNSISAPFHTRVIANESNFLDKLTRGAIVVLDGYQFDTVLQRKIKDKGAKLVCVDDHHHQEYLADLVINHAPGIKKENINGQPFTRYLLGPKYALLRKPFLEPFSKNSQSNNKIFICFGGSDLHDLSNKFLKILLEQEWLNSIDLVLGRDYSGICESINDNRLSISKELTPLQMRQLMRKNDIAIVPSSTILFECLSQGMKCVSGYYTDNQILIYNGFLAERAITGLGNILNCSAGEVQITINGLIKDSNNANIQGIFDGYIQERLINEFNAL